MDSHSDDCEEMIDVTGSDHEDSTSSSDPQVAGDSSVALGTSDVSPLPSGTAPEGGASFEKECVDRIVARDNSLKPDQTWYLISKRWLDQWKHYARYTAHDRYYDDDSDDDEAGGGISNNTNDADLGGANDRPRPGPIPNAELLDPKTGFQRKRMQESVDFNVIHQDLWNLFIKWYGGGPAFPRKVIAAGWRRGHYIVEVRPLHVKVMHFDSQDSYEVFLFSKAAKVKAMRDEICKKWSKDPKRIRMWDYHERSRIKLLADGQESLDEAQIIDGQYILVEEKDSKGKWPKVKKKSSKRYDAYADPTDPGCVGLNNMGNTCFMNSALQCLSNTPPLVNYLLDGRYRADLNEDNPLGTGGDLVNEYTSLVKGMWSGARRAIAPREFKYTLERFAPQFAGYSQHDSQELLAFLLDGIHEDLNRIRKKPYVENIEGGDRPDAEVAAESWSGHKLRNDSVVVDWFQGQLKSTVSCPDCPRVSITFDPFMYLSLPMPIKTTRQVTIRLIYYDPATRPKKFKLTIPKHGQISQMAAVLAEQTGLPQDGFFFCEVYNCRFFRIMPSQGQLSSVRERDDTCAYQTIPVPSPSSSSSSKTQETRDEKDDTSTIVDDGDEDGDPNQNTDSDPNNENAGNAGDAAAESDDEAAGSDDAVAGSDDDDGMQGADDWSDDETQWTGHSQSYDPYRRTPVAGPITCLLVNRKEELVTYTSYYRTSTYTRKTLFGAPMALCIRNDVTYEELYRAALARLERFIKPEEKPRKEEEAVTHTSSAGGAEDDDENDDINRSVGEGEGENESIADDNHENEASADDDAPTDEDDDEEEADEEEEEEKDSRLRLIDGKRPLFLIRATDNSSMHETVQLRNDGNPLMLKQMQTLSLCWTDEAIGRYDLQEAKEFEEDESFSAEQCQLVNAITVGSCMEMFTHAETLGEDDMWYCSKCGDFKQAEKKFDIWKAPRVLIVHLKRFSYRNRYWREKIDSFVDYPLENLDLSPHILGKCEVPPVYDLYAVSNHFGSLGGGHYTAFAKNHKQNQWYRFDDSSVHKATPDEVRTSAAYMLFYRRKDTLSAEPQITTEEGRAKDPEGSESSESDDAEAQDDGSGGSTGDGSVGYSDDEDDDESNAGNDGFSDEDGNNGFSDDGDEGGVNAHQV